MTKIKINYDNTIIYKLCCNDPEVTDIYVGHTTNYTKRKAHHKRSCNNPTDPLYNTFKYDLIRNNGGFNNWSMIELIKLKCEDVYEACRIERQYIEQLSATLNKNRPITTTIEKIEQQKTCSKEYRETHKEKIKEYRENHKEYQKEYQMKYNEHHREHIREYYQENRDKLIEYQREYTKKHIKALLKNDSTDDESS